MGRVKSIKADDILDAAAKIVSSKGVHNFSQSTLLEEAGISKGGLLYNFPSNEALIEALLKREYDRFNSECAKRVEKFKGHPYAEFLAYCDAAQADDDENMKMTMGILTALAHAPGALAIAQQFYDASYKRFFNTKTESGRKLQVAYLAGEGLFFMKFMGLRKYSKKEWVSILEDIKKMVPSSL